VGDETLFTDYIELAGKDENGSNVYPPLGSPSISVQIILMLLGSRTNKRSISNQKSYGRSLVNIQKTSSNRS
jgi:hypothetical protein